MLSFCSKAVVNVVKGLGKTCRLIPKSTEHRLMGAGLLFSFHSLPTVFKQPYLAYEQLFSANLPLLGGCLYTFPTRPTNTNNLNKGNLL